MNYWKITFLFLLFITWIGCNDGGNKTESFNKYSIKGKLEFPSESTLYLEEIIGNNIKKLDSVELKGKTDFEFNGKLSEPNFYRLELKNSSAFVFVLDTTPASVFMSGLKELPLFTMKGSKLNQDFEMVYGIQQASQRDFDSLNKSYIIAENMRDEAKIKRIELDYAITKHAFHSTIKKMISKNVKSIVSVYAASFLDAKQDFPFLDSLSEMLLAQKESSGIIRKFIDGTEKIKVEMNGSTVPNFTGDSPDGRKISLADYRGKVVLLDFWASWCGPCRIENPRVVQLYSKYKSRGFDILGISLDNNPEKWKNAIKDDGLTWNHISDLKGWDSRYALMFSIEEIPQTLLLDKEGKIIGKNLIGSDLEKKLDEVL